MNHHPPDASPVSAPASRERQLVRAMGVVGLAAGIVNVTIGGGIFRLPAGADAALGTGASFAYVACAVVMVLVVLCFAEAGSRVSLTGGLYAYVEVAFGPFAGFLTGALLYAGITAALAAVASFFADSLVALVPALGGAWARGITLSVVLALVGLLNVAGVRGASRFNTAMTLAKLLPLVLLVVAGFAASRAEYLTISTPAPASLAKAAAFLIFAFLGVESALVPSGEVTNPARTVPRAVFLALGVVVAIYLAVHLAAQGTLGPALGTSKTPLADAAGVAMGGGGRTLVLVGSALSMFGYVSGMVLAVPRMLFAFGRDGFLPSALAWVHPRFHTPALAIAVQVGLTILLALSGGFERLALIANGATLLAYAACAAAAWQLRRLDVRQGGDIAFHNPLGAATPVLALAAIAWLLSGLSVPEWIAVAIVAVLATALYFARRQQLTFVD
ncbi:MAG: APC family permease [Gemmatimonadaceae bacterium]